MTRSVYLPFHRPATVDGPRCGAACVHMHVTEDGTFCVAVDERLKTRTARSGGAKISDRCGFCRTCERMFGEPDPEQVMPHELSLAECAALRLVVDEWLSEQRNARGESAEAQQ